MKALNGWGKVLKGSLLFCACFVYLFPQQGRPESTDDYDDLIRSRNQEIQRLRNERKDTLNVISQYKEREGRVLELLKVLAENIETTEARLTNIQDTIRITQTEVQLAQRSVEDLQSQIDSDLIKIKRQLLALYYLKKVKSMTLFFGVDKFENYFRNQKLLKKNTSLDLQLLDRYNQNLTKLEEEFQRLKEQNAKLEELRVKESEQRTLLEFERGQQVTYLRHLREDHTSQIRYLREIQVELERLNDTLYSLETKKENQRKAETFQGLYKHENTLPKPVEGLLVHEFGETKSPFYTLFRRGVLVETVKNAEVKAVLAGKVAWSGPFRGYQNLVIVDHGKGSFSVYGNMEDVYVLVDDIIDQGELLGTVALDEVENKNLFYFEIRYNKNAVDPMKWLKKPVWKQK